MLSVNSSDRKSVVNGTLQKVLKNAKYFFLFLAYFLVTHVLPQMSSLHIDLTFDGVFFTFLFDGGGLILSTLFPFVKTIEKVFFLHCKI